MRSRLPLPLITALLFAALATRAEEGSAPREESAPRAERFGAAGQVVLYSGASLGYSEPTVPG